MWRIMRWCAGTALLLTGMILPLVAQMAEGQDKTGSPNQAETSGSPVSSIMPTMLAKVTSLHAEFTVNQQITDFYFAKMPSADRSFREMVFHYKVAAKGESWVYDLLHQNADGTVISDTRWAFNGVLHQQWDRDQGLDSLTISKKTLETSDNGLLNKDVFSLLYSFLRSNDGSKAKPIFFMKHIADPSLWASLMEHSKIVGKDTILGHPCIVLETRAGQSSEFSGKVFYRVAFAQDIPGMPLHWEIVDDKKNKMASLDVTKLQSLTLPGGEGAFSYPKEMRYTHSSYRDAKRTGPVSAILSQDYKIRQIAINRAMNDAVFTVDPRSVKIVHDVDNRRDIFVRTAKP